MRMSYLVCYDISDDKRLRRVFKAMRGYGDHLQAGIVGLSGKRFWTGSSATALHFRELASVSDSFSCFGASRFAQLAFPQPLAGLRLLISYSLAQARRGYACGAKYSDWPDTSFAAAPLAGGHRKATKAAASYRTPKVLRASGIFGASRAGGRI